MKCITSKLVKNKLLELDWVLSSEFSVPRFSLERRDKSLVQTEVY